MAGLFNTLHPTLLAVACLLPNSVASWRHRAISHWLSLGYLSGTTAYPTGYFSDSTSFSTGYLSDSAAFSTGYFNGSLGLSTSYLSGTTAFSGIPASDIDCCYCCF